MSQGPHIDLSDPRVRQLIDRGLHGDPGRISARNHHEMVQLAGDAPDPTGSSDGCGLLSTHRLTAGKQEVAVIYGDLFLTVDIYAVPEPMKIHIICPRCHKQSIIRADRKRVDFDPGELNPRFKQILQVAHRAELPELANLEFGRLSIEAFMCAWEIGDDPHVAGGTHTGGSLCRLRLAIENNRAREV